MEVTVTGRLVEDAIQPVTRVLRSGLDIVMLLRQDMVERIVVH